MASRAKAGAELWPRQCSSNWAVVICGWPCTWANRVCSKSMPGKGNIATPSLSAMSKLAAAAGYCSTRAIARRIGVSLIFLLAPRVGVLLGLVSFCKRLKSSRTRRSFSPQFSWRDNWVIKPSRVKPSGTFKMASAAWLASSCWPASPLMTSCPKRSNKKSPKCWALSNNLLKSSAPNLRTRLSGSSPSGTNTNFKLRPSCNSGRAFSSARQAASRPARSPS